MLEMVGLAAASVMVRPRATRDFLSLLIMILHIAHNKPDISFVFYSKLACSVLVSQICHEFCGKLLENDIYEENTGDKQNTPCRVKLVQGYVYLA